MKKPEKMIGRMFDGDGAWEEGYNQACDDWEKYHEWYIKTHCVRKEDLPSVEEMKDICISAINPTMIFDGTQINFDKLAKEIIKKIRNGG